MDCLYEFEPQTLFVYSLCWLSLAQCLCLKWTNDGEKNRARLYFYVEVKLIDGKTKYYKDRRGLEQEEVDTLLFEWAPSEIASIALDF